MIPPIVVAISILIYYAILIPYATSAVLGVRISLFDTYIGLILIYTATTLPFVIWMMLTFIDEVPYTLEHAARLMGAGRITVIRRIVLPLVASGMVVTFLFVFILNWAEFLLALTLTHPEVTTLTVLLNKFQSASGGPAVRAAGGDRHHDHDPGGDPRHADPEAPGQGLQLRHHPQVVTAGNARSGVARIVIKDLVKTFGAYTAVNGINLEIRDGEFLIMVGPSGCGKTTTLNMISGLETPTSGEIVIGNTVVNDLEPGERGLGMVFQDLALFPHMTVFENIAFGLRVKKVAEEEIDRVRAAAAEPCTSRRCWTSCRGHARAARASAWRSPARSSPTRRCS